MVLLKIFFKHSIVYENRKIGRRFLTDISCLFPLKSLISDGRSTYGRGQSIERIVGEIDLDLDVLVALLRVSPDVEDERDQEDNDQRYELRQLVRQTTDALVIAERGVGRNQGEVRGGEDVGHR